MVECGIVYFGLTGLFGGWDDRTLAEFEKAARMSGPSKFMVWPIFLTTRKFAKISPLHGKYSMPFEEALQEARELLALKHASLTQQSK
jgi:hypothetical protein